MKRFMGVMVIFLFTLMGLAACSQENGPGEQAAGKSQEQMQPTAAQQMAQPAVRQLSEDAQPQQSAALNEIRGTVVKTEDGIVIFSDSGNYLVRGEDLTGMVGKNVKVIGTVAESDGTSTVTVSSISVVE